MSKNIMKTTRRTLGAVLVLGLVHSACADRYLDAKRLDARLRRRLAGKSLNGDNYLNSKRMEARLRRRLSGAYPNEPHNYRSSRRRLVEDSNGEKIEVGKIVKVLAENIHAVTHKSGDERISKGTVLTIDKIIDADKIHIIQVEKDGKFISIPLHCANSLEVIIAKDCKDQIIRAGQKVRVVDQIHITNVAGNNTGKLLSKGEEGWVDAVKFNQDKRGTSGKILVWVIDKQSNLTNAHLISTVYSNRLEILPQNKSKNKNSWTSSYSNFSLQRDNKGQLEDYDVVKKTGAFIHLKKKNGSGETLKFKDGRKLAKFLAGGPMSDALELTLPVPGPHSEFMAPSS